MPRNSSVLISRVSRAAQTSSRKKSVQLSVTKRNDPPPPPPTFSREKGNGRLEMVGDEKKCGWILHTAIIAVS